MRGMMLSVLLLVCLSCVDDPGPVALADPPESHEVSLSPSIPLAKGSVTHGVGRPYSDMANRVRPISLSGPNDDHPVCYLEPYQPDDRMKRRVRAIQMPALGDDAALQATYRALLKWTFRVTEFPRGPDFYHDNLDDPAKGGALFMRSGLSCWKDEDGDGEEEPVSMALCDPEVRKYTKARIDYRTKMVARSARVENQDTIPGDMILTEEHTGIMTVVPGHLFQRQADKSHWCPR